MITRRQVISKAAKLLKAVFPVYKNGGIPYQHYVDWVSLTLEDEFDVSLRTFNIVINCYNPLEPFADGVMVLGFGTPGQYLKYLSLAQSIYDCKIKLGEETSSYEASGETTGVKPHCHVTESSLLYACQTFIGSSMQRMPPLLLPDIHVLDYGKGNKRATSKESWKESLERRAIRSVDCYDIKVTEFKPPYVSMRVKCDGKFKVRSFANDLGQKLDTMAHIVDLKRIKQGPFTESDCLRKHELHWNFMEKAHTDLYPKLLSYLTPFFDEMPLKQRRRPI